MKAKIYFNIVRSILLYILVYIIVALTLAMTPIGQAGGGMYLLAIVLFACGVTVLFTIKKGEFEILSRDRAKPVWYMVFSIIILSLGVTVFLNRIMEYIPWELFPGESVEQDNETLYGIPFYTRMIIYVGIAPLSEELLFRGAIFARLRKVLPIWVAVLISAFAFGVYHLNWMQGIYALFMGSIMAVLFQRYDSFLATLLFHMLANLWVNLAFALPAWNEFLATPVGFILSLVLSGIGIAMVICHNKIRKEK